MADSEQGLGKKILSFFIKEEETPVRQSGTVARPTPATATAPTSAAPEIQKPTVTNAIPNAAGTANIDRKFVEHFVTLLEKANLPGPDYFEYKQALKSMETLGLGEEKQFQAAWASFKAMGGGKETNILSTSANQYLSILDKDRTSFLKDVEKAINDRVGALQNEQQKLEDTNKAYAQQIADLQKKMDDNKNRLGQIAGEVTEQSAKINANKDSFEITYLSFVDQIKSDLTKINQYLK